MIESSSESESTFRVELFPQAAKEIRRLMLLAKRFGFRDVFRADLLQLQAGPSTNPRAVGEPMYALSKLDLFVAVRGCASVIYAIHEESRVVLIRKVRFHLPI